MADTSSLLRIAGWLMVLNAAFHLFAFLFGGLNEHTTQFIVVGLVYGLIAFGLLRGINLLACITFVIALLGFNAAYIGMGFMQIPVWLLGAIALTDIAVAAVLFVFIWNR